MPAKKQEIVQQEEAKPRKIEPEPPKHEHTFYLQGQDQNFQYWKCSGCPCLESRPYIAGPAIPPQPKGFFTVRRKERRYKVKYLCKNCAFKFKAKFIYGNPADKSVICPKCGVNDSKKL